MGGVIYTKNLQHNQKMPKKIIEGRNNWILMERDTESEGRDTDDNCEADFEQINEMLGLEMPRDFLAGLSKYFFRSEGEENSFFQEAQKEAIAIFHERLPHWRPRKVKSASTFLSIFFLVEREVTESNDETVKELYVEVFGSRDNYIDIVMEAMDKIDEVESVMVEGTPISIPTWTGGNGERDENVDMEVGDRGSDSIDTVVNNIAKDTLDLVDSMSEVERSKYVKVFKKDSKLYLGIQHPKIKILAKQKGIPVPKFKLQSKQYPNYVALKMGTFTKMNATSSKGACNTGPGFCTSIAIGKLFPDTKQKVISVMELSDDELLLSEDEADDENDVGASQDFPAYFQSQSETLKTCNHCTFSTRDKHEFMVHVNSHPKCPECRKIFLDIPTLEAHTLSHQKIKCNLCGIFVAEQSIESHKKNHKVTETYRKDLEENVLHTNKKMKASKAPTKLNGYLIFCRRFREEKKKCFLNSTCWASMKN